MSGTLTLYVMPLSVVDTDWPYTVEPRPKRAATMEDLMVGFVVLLLMSPTMCKSERAFSESNAIHRRQIASCMAELAGESPEL